MCRLVASIVLLLLLTGCTHYEFNVVEPPDLAGHVGRRETTQYRASRDPIDYIMQAVEGRLVMRIINAGQEPLELIGPESYVVDPDGQSHPLRTQPIAPDSYAKLILPPFRTYYRTGPSFGIGLGVGISRHYHRGYYGGGLYSPLYDPVLDQPRYLAAYDNSDNFYFDWNGESAIRARLTFRQRDETFHHDWVFQRVKAK